MKKNNYNIPNLPKDDQIKVPDNYFNNLEHNIMAKINAETKPSAKTKVFSLRPMAIAASVALLISAGLFINQNQSNKFDDVAINAEMNYFLDDDTNGFESNYEEGLEEEFAYE